MLYSALINVMVKAARRAGRGLKRDLGEIEHLQVSLKGPSNFVSLADKRAAELLRVAADAGNPEAQYALATFYKEGTGVEKDMEKAVRLLQAASVAGNVDAEVEYAIAMFNGAGTPKNQPAAVALLRKAARQNSPIAQNRLARVLAFGTGVPQDKVEALKWHWIAKSAGKGDPELDEVLADVPAADRARAEAAGRKWLGK